MESTQGNTIPDIIGTPLRLRANVSCFNFGPSIGCFTANPTYRTALLVGLANGSPECHLTGNLFSRGMFYCFCVQRFFLKTSKQFTSGFLDFYSTGFCDSIFSKCRDSLPPLRNQETIAPMPKPIDDITKSVCG